MAGTLYIVATPIGNLEDITLRAKDVLAKVDAILAEDTRVTGKLLAFLESEYNISSPKLISYHHHSKSDKRLEILARLVKGETLALVSDAGTPGISDPGNELIDFLLEKEPDLNVVPIPGASSVTSALSVSGFRAQRFRFLGYFPKRKKGKFIDKIASSGITVVYFDSPYRVVKNLEALKGALDSKRRVFVAREMTKMHETFYRGNIEDVAGKLKEKTGVRGEVVVVVEG
jgi:16S rRNA (cytidine1402-2'-O)-methyltransferase